MEPATVFFFGLAVYAVMMLRTFRDAIYFYYLFSIGWSLLTLALAAVAEIATLPMLAGWLRWPSLCLVAAGVAGLLLLPFGLRPSSRHGYRISGRYLFSSCGMVLLALVKLADVWALLAAALSFDHALQIMITAFVLVVTIVYGQRMPWVLTQQGALHHRASELARAAETDPLTGIANRAGFAASGLALLKEHALMMLGLDHFKPINDQFGHDSGDAVLQRVALRLQRIAGPRDVVARLGGDEFALMLASRSARDELAAFAQRLIREVTRPIQLHDQIHQVGASVGIARFPAHGEDLSQLMRCSDLALYQAKHAGRGTFAFFDDLPPSTTSFARL